MRHSLENFMSSIISETWKKGGGGGGCLMVMWLVIEQHDLV